jgi:hypothetical protein
LTVALPPAGTDLSPGIRRCLGTIGYLAASFTCSTRDDGQLVLNAKSTSRTRSSGTSPGARAARRLLVLALSSPDPGIRIGELRLRAFQSARARPRATRHDRP